MLLSLLKKLQKLKKLLLKLEKKQKKLTRKRWKWKKRLNFPRKKSHGLRTVGFFILGSRETLIQSQSQALQEFLYIASS